MKAPKPRQRQGNDGAENERQASAAHAHDNSSANSEENSVSLRNWIAVLGAALGAFMAVLDIQITNSSLADIQGALGATLDEGTWISTSYLVAEIVTIPLTAWLSRVFSVRLYILTNAVLFLIFSVSCAFTHNLNEMIVCRALQGFTGGTLIPMAFTIILSTLPKKQQPIGMAIYSLTATFAPSIGPAIGGWLTDNFGWQYMFYLNLLPGALLLLMLSYGLPKRKATPSMLKTGDWLGIISMALGLGCLEIVLEEGNRKDWFGSTMIVRLALVSGVALIIFLWHELRTKEPLVNLKLLMRRNFGMGAIVNTSLGMALYGSIYLLPVYLSQIQGYSPLQIGEVLIWSGLPQLVIIPMVPFIMKKVDGRILLVFGMAMFGSSCLMNSFMTHDYAGPQLTISLLVRALGQPFVFVPLSSLAMTGIEKAQVPSASAMFNMMRNLGGSIGVALLSTFVTRREQLHSARIGESISLYDPKTNDQINQYIQAFIAKGADAFTAHQQALQMLDSTVRREAYVMAYNEAFLLVGATLFICSLTALFLKRAETGTGAGAH